MAAAGTAGASREMTETAESENVALVRRYFDLLDGRVAGDISELFAADAQLYIPTFGIIHGAGTFAELSSGVAQRAKVRHSTHHVDEFNVIEHGDTIVVEGTSEGETVNGQRWDGRKTIGGRFCNVFEVRHGRIARLHVYVDPDFCREDTAR
jgi:ketosteroid isomerase-like protein